MPLAPLSPAPLRPALPTCRPSPPPLPRAAPQLLFSGGWDHTVLMWDLRLGRAVRSFSGPYVCGGDGLDVRGEQVRRNNGILPSSFC